MGSEKQEKELMKLDGSTLPSMPFISPPTSLATSISSVSSYSDYSIDAASYGRGYQEGSNENGQEDPSFRFREHSSTHANGIYVSNSLVENNIVESNNIYSREAKSLGSDNLQAGDNGVERAVLSADEEMAHFSCDEKDSQLWFPPDPEDQEDDLEGSVANYDDDDDDDCGDGMNWSSLSSFGEEGRGSYRFKEEKKKAMDEVMNGKFKTLVGQLLKSMGISCSGNDGDNWVDKVTSLSWEAASFVKPDAFEGKAMDPDGYVKVKCIATGSRSQSEVFRGLVFKKHAAHKHMPTNCKKPKLLLIKGALSVSSNGLSSFDSMKQEKDRLDSIVGMIEKCHPDVVLVEKTVSRDIQESILAKGITLVLEMKLHRLERVARCTGSPILSSDKLNDQKLRHCDSFRFEKIAEELATLPEGGKMPSKTLMFLEGCPKRLGCTILLKGSHSEELKRIKFVVQFAVVMAYHLILESSFLLDQRAMFSTISLNGLANLSLSDKPSVGSVDGNVPLVQEFGAETDLTSTVDIPISNGLHEEGSHDLGLEGDSLLSYEPYNPVVFSGLSHLSASLKKAVGNRFPLFSTTRQYMSMHFGFTEGDPNSQTQTTNQVLSSPEVIDHSDVETKGSSDEDKTLADEQMHLSSTCEVFLETQNSDGNCEEQMKSKDDICTVLDSESILVLMSSRNSSRGTICEQSHFSCIKFYRNFDVPLGKFLRDNLLNQRLLCGTCGEPPEAHLYYYAHHNKQLTIQVKRIDKHLPGESEGKLWMWSCCGKCKRFNGNSKSTKRVLISNAARGLSFGKFLELGFSSHSSFGGPSSCGHSFHRDFLYFFGLGSMVAMLRYSTVATYAVSLPCQELTLSNAIRGDFLRKEIEHVYEEGTSMFLEVENSLKEMGSQFVGSLLNLQGSFKEFSDVEKMLKQERDQFEVDMASIGDNGNHNDDWVYKPLHLNHVQWELLLESCVWDQRLYSLLSSDLIVTDSRITDEPGKEQSFVKDDAIAGEETDGAQLAEQSGDEVFENTTDLQISPDVSLERNDSTIKEILIEGNVHGCRELYEPFNSSDVTQYTERSTMGEMNNDRLSSSTQLAMGRIVPITRDVEGGTSDLKGDPFPVSSKLEDPKGWMWTPFPDIRRSYMNDLQGGYLPKFELLNSYPADSRIHKLISEEGSRLHFPLGTKDYIVSEYEDELSSIIACALTLLNDLKIPTEDVSDDVRSYESSQRLARLSSLTSSHWSSFSSADMDGIYSAHNISSEESHFSSFDGLKMFDSVVSLGSPHPLVSMGRLAGKGKYSVACLYASHFVDLRKQCGLSEPEYIASLSRCANWDAKGGKSKSLFAKTLDDRFIIKEIKKTEFHSFVEFASDYFKYMSQCFELGNQTCLAKILGIYKVSKKQSGIKHDLMVIENLTYGRSIRRQYDLKGALHARFSSAADGSGDVLLDQNFVNDMNVSPLYVNRRAKRKLQRAVWNDTAFLNSINVMDYSLLVGVDAQKHELVCGIIDYLRQYTWDKQLENWVKSSLVPKNQLPTVISPKEYKKRFRKFIDTHFLSVPDDWCSQRSLNPCSLCGEADNKGSDSHSKSQGKQNGFYA